MAGIIPTSCLHPEIFVEIFLKTLVISGALLYDFICEKGYQKVHLLIALLLLHQPIFPQAAVECGLAHTALGQHIL